jgi:hypothetical protein
VTALHVLVVENEAAIVLLLLLENAIGLGGNSVAKVATNIKDPSAAAAMGDFGVAPLDINLNGQRAHALPVTLSARGKPFKFDTSCGGSRRARPLRRSAGRQEAVRDAGHRRRPRRDETASPEVAYEVAYEVKPGC